MDKRTTKGAEEGLANDGGRSGGAASNGPTLPAVTLPKGGGALRGLGEKVAVSPTGSASLSVPLPISTSRAPSGTPSLALSYDSGSGNGPFGLGWSMALPAIARKTEKALPRYLDGEDSDVFILSGFEDLVPLLVVQPDGTWTRDTLERDGYRVDRYRPRIEGAFARIERWTDRQSGDAYWRSITKDNITTVYGRSAGARIFDPNDPRRIYKWLIEETTDDQGNVVAYEYQQEDAVSVDAQAPAERNRIGAGFANRYLKYVHYGNQTPFVAGGWHFELVFDFGDHDPDAPELARDHPWPARRDPFSSYRAGFEIRTYRLCRRVLMFHVFDELRAPAQLVRTLELRHAESPIVTTVTSFVQTGYSFDATGYHAKSLPALELAYTTPAVDPQLQVLDRASAGALPAGLAAPYQWVDLDSEGLSGVLTEQGDGWFYKRNLGGAQLGDLELVAQRPRSGLRAGAQLLDLANDGRKYLVEMSGPLPGAYRREHDPDTWGPFAPFASMPVLDWTSKYQRMLDLDGDGLADVLVTEDSAWSWYPSLGTSGFGPRETVPVARDEERGPTLVFADPTESIFLADLAGDGLVDLVRVRNGEICYWPNLGYGKFGAKVTMTDAPVFDRPELFDPRRVRFCDIDGTGAVDVLYLDHGSIRYWLNAAGNAWSAPQVFDHLPDIDNLASIAALDFLGNGTSCVVWSSSAPRDAGRPLAYLDLMGGQKPYLLASVHNNLGAETAVAYAPSTSFYVEDRANGTPWVTRVPFPVQVVARIETRDVVTGNKFVSSYSYHHGYYDGPEQEFRGFGRVDQLDTEAYEPFAGAGLLPPGSNIDAALHVPPVLTKTWYHTGAFLDGDRISTQLAHEYWTGDPDPQAADLDDTTLPSGLTTAEQVEACRALKGQILRQEVYALDDTPQSTRPYSVTERSFAIVRVQPFGTSPHASFFAHPREVIELHYERGDVPDPRVLHTFTLEVDVVGNLRRSAAVAYPRRGAAPFPEQARIAITASEVDVINVFDQSDALRLGVPLETRGYEVVPPAPVARYALDAFAAMLAALTDVPAEATATPGTRRLLSRSQATYYTDDLSGPLPLGQCGTRALPHQSYRLAFTPALVTALWGDRVTDAMLTGDGKYESRDGAWWAPSGRAEPSPEAFYRAVRFFDPFGNVGSVAYDKYTLLVERTDSSDDLVLDNVTLVENDYRTLGPWRVTDPNGNRAAVRADELGLVIATAVMGKATGPAEGDTLDDPTTRYEYDLDVVPAWGHQLAREQHGAANTRWLESYEYSDGFGRVVQKKAQAEPDPITQAPRWVGTGRAIVNNKGLPVKQYEPFFSTTFAYEDEAAVVASGVTPIMHYDPLGRVVRTDLPDGSYSRVELDAWSSASWDRNDTVLDSRWYQDHTAAAASADDQRAAQLTAAHAGTPTITYVDPLGRTFLSILDNGPDGPYQTRNVIDVEGRTIAVLDDRGRSIAAYRYDLLGLRGYASLLDSGERWTLVDVAGKPIRSWDSRGHARRLVYDHLQRATHAYLSVSGDAEVLVQRTVHGERVAGAAASNLRGEAFQFYDGAGVVTSRNFDFKGHLRTGERRVASNYQTLVDWTPLAQLDDPGEIATAAEPLLEPDVFATTTTFDALERVIQVVTSDGSVITPAYNVASLLERTTVAVRGGAAREYVSRLEYDAKGRRTLIDYGTAQTRYTYDAYTFRTVTATTTRKSDGATLQGLAYTYDPSGNLVAIVDSAQPTIYFKNAVVSPSTAYVYDAVYRLRQADGREHVSSLGASAVDFDDAPRVQLPAPGDGQAMQRYREVYTYDAVGNLLSLVHTAAQGSWNRPYHYDDDSNQLRWTDVATSSYGYDTHGNMTAMPHLASMMWDDRDQLSKVDLGGGGTAYYTYGSNGQRLRKVIVSLGGAIRERIYLGGYEVYRERSGATITLERQSLHVMDDSHRIALVETLVRDQGVDLADPTPAIRYQLDNHLGSSVVELDEHAAVISYEEYYPYGSTSYQAGRNASETSLKRYRYIGKERDDETGFYYHGARYYAPWIARWTACDPIGIADAASLYVYGRCNPIVFSDPNGKQSEWTCTYILAHPPGSPVSGLMPGPDCVIKEETFFPEFHRPGSTGPIQPAPPPPPKVVHKPPKPKPEPPKEKPVSIETLMAIAYLGQTHYHYDPFAERVFGAGQVFVGVLELGGAVLSSETIVGAGVLGAQAGDDVSTGAIQIWTGKHEDSMKYKLGSLLTAQVTNDKQWQSVGGQSFEIFGNVGVGAVGMWEASRGISLAPSIAADSSALERFTTQFYASKGQLLNQQASEIDAAVRPLVKNQRFVIGVSTSFVGEEQFTVVTASSTEAWEALGKPGVLPPEMYRGPDPTPFIHNGVLDDLKHVEFLGPEWLGDRGAKAAIIGTSSPACLGSCTPIWTHPTLAPTDMWHTNVPGLTLGNF